MQKHLQAELEDPLTRKLSIAYWAFVPTRTIVVFVHGFGGNAVGTWKEFDERLPARVEHDLLFFGCDGLFRHATESAIDLFQVLDNLGSNGFYSSRQPQLTNNPTLTVRQWSVFEIPLKQP